MLGRLLLEPSYSRSPAWRGSELDQAECNFACSCGAAVSVRVADLTRAAWTWEQELGPDLSKAATARFQLNAVGRSHDGGSPALVRQSCAACGARFLVYAGVEETSNSVYSVTLQGVSELAA